MASSPFADFANATLTFTVADSGSLVTDVNGNLRPGRSEVQVRAMLNQSRPPSTQPRPGVDTSAIYLKGFAVEPVSLPPAITPDSPCKATWNGSGGDFVLEFQGRSSWGYEESTGDRIRGYFSVRTYARPPLLVDFAAVLLVPELAAVGQLGDPPGQLAIAFAADLPTVLLSATVAASTVANVAAVLDSPDILASADAATVANAAAILDSPDAAAVADVSVLADITAAGSEAEIATLARIRFAVDAAALLDTPILSASITRNGGGVTFTGILPAPELQAMAAVAIAATADAHVLPPEGAIATLSSVAIAAAPELDEPAIALTLRAEPDAVFAASLDEPDAAATVNSRTDAAAATSLDAPEIAAALTVAVAVLVDAVVEAPDAAASSAAAVSLELATVLAAPTIAVILQTGNAGVFVEFSAELPEPLVEGASSAAVAAAAAVESNEPAIQLTAAAAGVVTIVAGLDAPDVSIALSIGTPSAYDGSLLVVL